MCIRDRRSDIADGIDVLCAEKNGLVRINFRIVVREVEIPQKDSGNRSLCKCPSVPCGLQLSELLVAAEVSEGS